ncbi:TetR family transcriptional regulator C-terminal domain-containing protein [Aestuariispira insulae]|uniref:TetR family transcriptional regulator n=1 Tax=Aestuariispira insulae TaxID=1461337 RepID=A0A3D9HS47_9PROT|nr:TetR family transcriptional regulator C-terminal domain-containing protein [Aestuariispira insulae]RED52290.1 TetR family transcriptional regulator [Aestuariispira insulae]
MAEAEKTQPKFHRLEADERREALINATIRCLARLGPRATSVREICAEAGVSPGLLRHYFEGKDDLVAQAYLHLTSKLNERVESFLLDQAQPPESRLEQLFLHILTEEWVSDEILGVWVAFWSLQRSDERLSNLHRVYNREFRDLIGKVLEELAAEREIKTNIRLAAISLSSLLDGLWLELCLDPDGFSAQEGIAICRSWLDGFLGRDVHDGMRNAKA